VIHSEFSERYLATRERLSAVIHDTAALAKETGIDVDHLLTRSPNLGDLNAPWLFAVAGELNGGKSDFINGLAGQDLCTVSGMTKSGRIQRYRHGRVWRNHASTAVMEIHERPADFLRDLDLVDVPSVALDSRIQSELVMHLLPSADVIFIVVSASDPWAAAAWNTIAAFPPEILDKTIMILQHTDPFGSCDLKVITRHMAELATKRTGRVLPVFASVGKPVAGAERIRTFVMEGDHANGNLDLEQFIGHRLRDSVERQASLKTWYERAASAIRLIEDHLESQSHLLGNHGRFLDTIEREIDDMRERFIARLPKHLERFSGVFELESIGITQCLSKRLHVMASYWRLFSGDCTGASIEILFTERLQAEVLLAAEHDAVDWIDQCRRHWANLGTRVKDQMGIDLANPDHLDEILTSAKGRFAQRLQAAAQHGLDHLRVRHHLEKQIQQRNSELQSILIALLASTSASGIAGALGVQWLPEVFSGISGLIILGGVAKAISTRKGIADEFQRRLLHASDGFTLSLREDHGEALRLVFRDYASALSGVKGYLFREKLALVPRLKSWKELFLTLKAVEQDL